MENMNTNEIINVEATEVLAPATVSESYGWTWKDAAILVGLEAAGITAWELAIKPAYRWTKGKVKGLKAKRQNKKRAKAEEIDPADIVIEDVPEIK